MTSSVMSLPVHELDSAAPPVPQTIEQTGLSHTFLEQHLLRLLYFRGELIGREIAQSMGVQFSLIEPLIIVAVANTGEERIHEYAPTRGVIDAKAKRKKRSKGLARKYGHFLIDELKPYIDRKYQTNPDAEFTGLGGSSLGGLVTLAIGILYPHAFSRLMVMSPSIWWDDFAIYRLVDSIEQKPPLKIWLDTGTAEAGWEPARELLNRLVEKGWKRHKDLQYMEAQSADHSEAAWAARAEPALRFLFPPTK